MAVILRRLQSALKWKVVDAVLVLDHARSYKCTLSMMMATKMIQPGQVTRILNNFTWQTFFFFNFQLNVFYSSHRNR